MESKKGKSLVLYPVPLQGHINPMIQLANVLHTKGFTITIIHTKFNAIDHSKYPHFTFRFIPDGLLQHEASTSDVVGLVLKLNSNCVKPFRECLENLLSDGKGEPVACLIVDFIWYFTREIASSFNLPRFVFRTSSICSSLVSQSIPLLRKLGYYSLQNLDSRLEEEVPEIPPLKVKDIPAVMSRDPEKVFRLVICLIESTEAASGLIFNSFRELEEQQLTKIESEYHVPAFTIGPLHKYFPASSSSLMEQDRSAIRWLDKQAPKSVLYVSFGSVVEMDESQLSEVAWGIDNSMKPFLWVIRPGLVQNSSGLLENLPNGFAESIADRGYIVNWAPQQEILAHPAVGAFWTHSGWNSTLESICEGVPMICSPFFGDQRINSRFVNDVWKIGLLLENGFEKGEIESVIRRIMVDKEGEEMRERALTYKEKINACIEEGGSSYQSLKSLIDFIWSF